MPGRVAVLATAFVLSARTPVAGQQATIELGAARLRQPSSPSRDALVAAFGLRTGRGRLAFAADAGGTIARDSVAAAQLVGAAAFVPRGFSWWRTESAASFARFDLLGSGSGRSATLGMRQHIAPREWAGGWVGAEAGRTHRSGVSTNNATLSSAAWARYRGVTLTGGVNQLFVDDIALVAAPPAPPIFGTARFYDYSGGVEVRYARWSGEYRATRREGASMQARGGRASLARVAWRPDEHVSFEFAFGKQLADPVRGAPESKLAMLLLRLHLIPISTPAVTVSLQRAATGSGAILVVRVKGDRPAEVAGTFTGWRPAPLARTKNGWEGSFIVAPGTQRIVVRVGGGAWRVPENLPRVRDEFGSEVGLIVVP
ncbi:MAG: glycogen-binding domain-containing protein [Gemmatimonadaceae bacterium]|nr:glycogen-binding domain-containing protein [Gemmatimonadaceae bacterium]